MDGISFIWTNTAINQRNQVFDYWNKRNKSKTFSKKLNLQIRERIELIKNHPKTGKSTIHKDTKMVAMCHYSLFYKVYKNEIIITAFWDNRQDSKKLFFLLK